MSRSYGKPRRGRVHVDEDEVLLEEYGSNFNVDIDIDAGNFNPDDFEVSPEHQIGIATTIDHSEKPGTRKDYRSRLQRMVDWCITHYPNYAKIATRDVTEAELNDTTKHYYNQTKDFVYQRLSYKLVLAFLSYVRKENADGTGKTRSFVHVRKFNDAILFGAREQSVKLDDQYKLHLKKYLASFRKESKVATGTGQTDLEKSDPMSFDLYSALCTWYVDEGCVYNWLYQILLWNCMGRSASVDPLGLHNFRLGTDSIIITYDRSKSDMGGERVHPKNCYANPYNPYICPFLAMGVWCLLYPEQFDNTDFLFIKKGCELGSASKRFGNHLRSTVISHREVVSQWAVPERIGAHSARKGSATHLTAGTLNPPPLPSVAHRGEWSQGTVQDIYFNFAQPGDHYIGRMLAGLDPNSTRFRVLPPHFTCGLENEYVKLALDKCFGRILKARENLIYLPGFFLRLLASIVYHEQWIRRILEKNKKHPFGNIYLFEDTELLKNLRDLVTTDATTNMQMPTGIPTHIDLNNKLERIIENNIDFLDQLKAQSIVIQEAVKHAIQENDILSGNVTMPILTEKLETHHNAIIEFIKKNTLQLTNDNANDNNEPDYNTPGNSKLSFLDSLHSAEGTPSYVYNGKFWDVPSGFNFPKNPTRKVGWEYWLRGKLGNEMLVNGIFKKAPIKPFRKMIRDCLPESEQNVWGSTWRPIYDYMETALKLEVDEEGRPIIKIPSDPKEITNDFIDLSYEVATNWMKKKVSYIWELKNRDLVNWTICTWSKYISNSFVAKLGNDNDKTYLPVGYVYVPRKQKVAETVPVENSNNKRQKVNNNNNHVRQSDARKARNKKVTTTKQKNKEPTRSVADMFATAFVPEPAFVELATATAIQDNVIDVDDVDAIDIEKSVDQSNPNSTDPSLHVQLPGNVNDGSIPNASRTTAAEFTAAVTTMILEAARIDTDNTVKK